MVSHRGKTRLFAVFKTAVHLFFVYEVLKKTVSG